MPEEPVRRGGLDIYPGDTYRVPGGTGTFYPMSPGMIELYDLMYNRPQFFRMLWESLSNRKAAQKPAPAITQPVSEAEVPVMPIQNQGVTDDELVEQEMNRRKMMSNLKGM